MAREGITQTTLRMKDELHERFEQTCTDRGDTMTTILIEAVEAYVGDRIVTPKTSNQVDRAVQISLVAHSLADAVSSYLRNNPDWASAVVESSKLGLPGYEGDLGFSGRMKHFSEEKAFLASNFLQLLHDRIWHYLTDGRKRSVTLVCDSGTTLYWFLRYLPAILKKDIDADASRIDEWKKLRVVTNNLSGIEAFVTECALHPLKSGKLVSDVVSCYVLPGKILPVYEAITGKDTDAALRKYRNEADLSFGDDHLSIGLVTGNWLQLTDERLSKEGERIPPYPAPFARGDGHLEFKQTLIQASHEVYCVSPLGKLLIGHSVDDLNNILKYSELYREVCEAPFLVDSATVQKVMGMKLVSTIRSDGQLLSNHSLLLQNALRSRFVTEHSNTNALQDFAELPHFLYRFDWHAQKTREEQKAIEFPHENTRLPEFAQFFKVSW